MREITIFVTGILFSAVAIFAAERHAEVDFDPEYRSSLGALIINQANKLESQFQTNFSITEKGEDAFEEIYQGWLSKTETFKNDADRMNYHDFYEEMENSFSRVEQSILSICMNNPQDAFLKKAKFAFQTIYSPTLEEKKLIAEYAKFDNYFPNKITNTCSPDLLEKVNRNLAKAIFKKQLISESKSFDPSIPRWVQTALYCYLIDKQGLAELRSLAIESKNDYLLSVAKAMEKLLPYEYAKNINRDLFLGELMKKSKNELTSSEAQIKAKIECFFAECRQRADDPLVKGFVEQKFQSYHL